MYRGVNFMDTRDQLMQGLDNLGGMMFLNGQELQVVTLRDLDHGLDQGRVTQEEIKSRLDLQIGVLQRGTRLGKGLLIHLLVKGDRTRPLEGLHLRLPQEDLLRITGLGLMPFLKSLIECMYDLIQDEMLLKEATGVRGEKRKRKRNVDGFLDHNKRCFISIFSLVN
jgi:hypothetical protein